MTSIKIITFPCVILLVLTLLFMLLFAKETQADHWLRVLTWEGYVTQEDVDNVNLLLKEQGYKYKVDIVSPYAQGAEQMFDIIRAKQCDITFLTLFFIKMQKEKTAKLIQAIDIHSPRLTNYADLYPNLTGLDMGMNSQNQPLYIPWGGGIYGFYINKNKVRDGEIPESVDAFWKSEWREKFSLNQSQEWYNLGLALMKQGLSPFSLYEAIQQGDRQAVREISNPKGELQQELSSLYHAAGDFWKTSPKFHQDLLIVSSWGPEIYAENEKGSNWQLIDFKEGHMAWLDTINFVKGLEGRKLEAAEIFANYFISKQVQTRVSRELSMVPASRQAPVNSMLGDASKILKENMFVPPYDHSSYEIMKKMTDKANRDANQDGNNMSSSQ
ncbi:spermidine/putrescine-binding periplasmic protein [Shewanella psychrophila]|uniref:Spermidine/putrescine-binding periplasmic protein n=1 Tax=Shewanella psychrophila TaxID=225848 RepID=A0A1S6HKM4_9GAMM|nr:PotD/PotF family extracellular solute-binding protein [Shewanella psychrophila]AQS36085.1 spermidine/putrescine-binding periplasmic protein [Shewanella psychrophila]